MCVESTTWPGPIPIAVAAYSGGCDLPAALVSSIRCVVTVGDQVLVCQDAGPSIHIWLGGRCEAGESWLETAQREVWEETGWRLDPPSVSMLGFLHFRHLTPMPDAHPFPHPDFLQVVMHGEATGVPRNWVDIKGYVERSWLVSPDAAMALPLSAAGRAFLGLLHTSKA